MSVTENVTNWLDDRLALRQVRAVAEHKTVPMHRLSVFYYLGGVTLFFFLVQVCTGVLLMLYYRPSADEAFESVEFIMTTVPFGWLIRSVHSWSANLMVFFAFIHMVSVFFLKAYRAPRELTWVTGVLIFFLVLGFGFSGYLLPWNQLAFFATKVGTDVSGAIPVVGEWIVRFMRGGDRVSGATLARFYGWHVAILPALTLGLLGAHLALVQMKGMSVPPAVKDEAARRPAMKFFPHFALRDLAGWIMALGVLAALAALLPWELGEKADLFAPAYEDIKPEWYYIFMFQTLKLVPGGEIFGVEYEAFPMIGFGLAGLILMLVPFLDRKVGRTGRSPLFTIAGIVSIIFMVAMTCWGYKSLLPLYILLATGVLLAGFAFITRGPRSTLLAVILLGAVASDAQSAISCAGCHEDKAKMFGADVHARVGLSCHDCHGGNPDAAVADDMTAAHAAKGFVGAPKRPDMPGFCGRCHSDAVYMKRFNPAARVDQVDEYWTSQHGKLLRQGDTNVAVCVDCHSVHDIRRHTQTDSPVYASRVAETCSRCHSDAKRMAGYKDDHGRPLRVDQFARWKVSVHANAMFAKGDLTAPTCNDCHGNHGATPPGVESVSFVCGQCHLREAELFRTSRKAAAWAAHNEMMAGAECSSCHDDHRAKLPLNGFSGCITCHDNHGIIRPTVAMLDVLPETPCAFCHEGSGPLAARVPEPKDKAANYARVRDQLKSEAARQGLKGDDQFDWLVDRLQALPYHRLPATEKGAAVSKLRPEFARLFDKFRIGKTKKTYRDTATGRDVTVAVRRCRDCHPDADSTGSAHATAYVNATRGLTSMIGRAERILLKAQRGGVEVRKVRTELDGAVDSQIELETLVHTFDPKDMQAKQKEGLQHAEAALIAGQGALDELGYRRRGLLIALGVIVVTLAGLALKIRML